MNNKTFDRILLILPLLQVVLDMLLILFSGIKNIIGPIRIVILGFIILYFLNFVQLKKTSLNKTLLIYIFYLFIICFLSTDWLETFIDGFLKVVISLMMFPIGAYLGQKKDVNIMNISFWTLFLLSLNYILSQLFKVGSSLYDEDSFYSGAATATTPIIISINLLVLFNGFNNKKLKYSNKLTLILAILSIFFVLISLKRGAILSLFTAILAYILISGRKLFIINRLLIIASGLIIFLLYGNFSDNLQKRYDARTTERNEIQNENRYKETLYVIDEIQQNSWLEFLIGKEPFNSKKTMLKYFGRERQLHIDYNILLYGTGIIGLLLYLIVIFKIYSYSYLVQDKILSERKNNSVWSEVMENHALIVSLLVMSFVMSFSGGLQFLSYRVILFFVLGYFVGQNLKIYASLTN